MREEYQELIDEISARLGTPATLEGRDFGLIAFGAHDSDDDRVMDPVRTRSILRRRSTAQVRAWFESFGIARAQGPVRIPADPSAGVLTGRLCLPARHGGVVHGYIWLLDDGVRGAGDPRLTDAMSTAARIGALLAGEARTGSRRGSRLRTLLTASPALREAAGTELAEMLGPAAAGPMAMIAVTPWVASGEEGLPMSGLPAVLAATALPSGLAGLVRLRSTSDPLEPARLAARELLRSPWTGAAGRNHSTPDSGAAPEPGSATAGVSAPRTGLAELPAAWREAVSAARAARAGGPRHGPVADWEQLGPYRLLTALPDSAPDPAVRTLLDPAHRELARSAEVFLDHAGQAGAAAAALGIHRQTLYYRLSRVERLTGLDLHDGEARLLLHMALKTVRLRDTTG
ncbi:helix-turn-helix domain-containing protein [Streptomyces sp. ACA25]|uniref:PucR family transcriptional regulator n=1 Tax=Streptomyces sp. ACA25 TaxID=3022596 RepID=UPI0023070B59|nr:helix-turn-helix domain-containing protein [Streptomyces sp. ACA25]MDB1088387.1 helix-turn-helix domain-containing protein [Streptomyces sp. ACA25]